MIRIRQEHLTSCGIACVATVTGTSYSDVLKIACEQFKWKIEQRTFYTSSTQLKKLLSTFNVESKKSHSIQYWSSMPETAIAGINYSEKSGIWHWVVFRREDGVEYVLDPKSKREVRKDFGRMRLHSCIPIRA